MDTKRLAKCSRRGQTGTAETATRALVYGRASNLTPVWMDREEREKEQGQLSKDAGECGSRPSMTMHYDNNRCILWDVYFVLVSVLSWSIVINVYQISAHSL